MSTNHSLMRLMVWNMRWMTRYAGFVARPIVRIYGANEVIACGLRDVEGRVCIIYTPGWGSLNHAASRREGREWVDARFDAMRNFSGSVVRCVSVPQAENGMKYKMIGSKPSGRRLSSPMMTVKPKTIENPSLLEVKPTTDRAVVFSWPGADSLDPMIYFLAIEDGENTCSAIYTREHFWRYPKVKSASYSVGPSEPPVLTPKKRYVAKLVLVDYDGWVGHMATRTFEVP